MKEIKKCIMKRTKTNIQGFDRLIGGGFPLGSQILLSGTPGTGKTIFALQYLYNGVMKNNEKGLYVSFEEKTCNLMNQANQFGWNLAKLNEKNKLTLLHIPPNEIKDNLAQDLVKMIKKNKISRLVIDSLSALSINIPTTYNETTEVTEYAIKRFMYLFINELRKLENTTTLLISQTMDKQLSRDSVSEFIADGIILLSYEALGGDYSRNLIVRKMRQVKNNEDIHPLEIGKKGIVVHKLG